MKKYVMYLFSIMMLFSCSSSNDVNESSSNSSGNNSGNNGGNSNNGNQDWLIPLKEVVDGGPGKDGIPSIDNPRFVDVRNQTFLDDDDLVIGVVHSGEAKAYSHGILNWHEIVNDTFNDQSITVNYCPLTGTAFGWQSIANGSISTFGVSGLLYNANLILYDRNTGSNWSQLRLECVNGSQIGDTPTLISVVETNWHTWKTLYPSTKVLSDETDFWHQNQYKVYPYGRYLTDDNFFIFQVARLNSSLPHKQRVFAIINNNKVKVYQFSDFQNGKVIIDSFNGKDYLVVGNENIINAFELSGDYTNLTFQYDFTNTETFFKDNEGNEWSVFGKALTGPRSGENLSLTKSVVSFWFAIGAFYPDPVIYSE